MWRLSQLSSVFVSTWLLFNSNAWAKDYKPYEVDWEPLKKNPALYQEYVMIFGDGKEQKSNSRAELERGFAIIESLLKSNPKWLDGYWLLGSTAFQWGSSYNDEKDHPLARSIFVKGQKAAETCLKIDPQQPLCKLFLGSSIGSISSIDGVISSLRTAKKIERLWLDVIESGINFHFFPAVTMQGSVRYGLGMFYRLVPDSWIIEFLFDVRGSLDKSITMHREGIAIDGNNACSDIMLGVSLICKAKGETKQGLGKEGQDLLKKTSLDKTSHLNLQMCVQDAAKIAKDPDLACGYTTTKQQDLSDEAIEKQKRKSAEKKELKSH